PGYFVNIVTIPPAPVPLPAPGITVVLPLPSFTTPGTAVTLWRIDDATGSPVPEPWYQNGTTLITAMPAPVAVISDGLSAIYINVLNFSNLVSLQPGSTMLGDVNADGKNECADIAIIEAAFGKRVGQVGYQARADVNGDSVVNIIDLSMVSRLLPAGLICK